MRYLLILILFGCFLSVFGQNRPSQINESKIESKNADRSKTEIYIPADQRHKGLSRYDLIPFTDREKGDPDRYRAVNPKYVKRENGRYFYALNVKGDTHFYDENFKDAGILSASEVAVDLTRTAQVKGGEKSKYVFVKGKGYVAASAIEQDVAEIRAGRWFAFPLKSGENGIYDGIGIKRGTLAGRAVRLNYGLQKEIGGEIYYYAFSTQAKIIGEIIGASGWIKASTIETGNDPQFDRNFIEKMQMPTAAGDVFTEYEITGGEVRETIGKDENGTSQYRFGYADRNGEFIAYKVLPKIPLGGKQSVAATDYLKRSDEVINLGFNVAGVSNDTFRIGAANRPLIFYRSAEPDATAAIDLFYPLDAAHDGEKIVGQMVFVYGYVIVLKGKRWGWIPLAALKLKTRAY